MIELFIQKHLAKSCGAKDRKAKSQSVNQFNIDSGTPRFELTKKKLTSTVNQIHTPLS